MSETNKGPQIQEAPKTGTAVLEKPDTGGPQLAEGIRNQLLTGTTAEGVLDQLANARPGNELMIATGSAPREPIVATLLTPTPEERAAQDPEGSGKDIVDAEVVDEQQLPDSGAETSLQKQPKTPDEQTGDKGNTDIATLSPDDLKLLMAALQEPQGGPIEQGRNPTILAKAAEQMLRIVLALINRLQPGASQGEAPSAQRETVVSPSRTDTVILTTPADNSIAKPKEESPQPDILAKPKELPETPSPQKAIAAAPAPKPLPAAPPTPAAITAGPAKE